MAIGSRWGGRAGAEVHRADDWQQQHVLHPGDGDRAGGQRGEGMRRQSPQEVSDGPDRGCQDLAGARAGQCVLRGHQEDKRRTRSTEARQSAGDHGAGSHLGLHNRRGAAEQGIILARQRPSLDCWV